MIATRWADANGYLSNRRADWDEKTLRLSLSEMTFKFLSPFPLVSSSPPFVPLFPLQPLLPPIIPLTSSVLPLSLPVCLARPRALYARARVDGAGCATIVQKWINNSYAKLQTVPLQPSISRTTPLASRADRRRELAWCSGWWMVYDYSKWRIGFILQSVEYVEMLH